MTAKPILTESISKHYGNLKAADNISISIDKGEIYGFLGLNGAGKTTTIRIILGLINPVSGTVYLNGSRVKPGEHDIWSRVGSMVEIPYSYPDLTVRENLEIIRRLRLIADKDATGRIIEKLNLGSYRDVKAGRLSLGNAQRLGLAKALIHDPEILILDEPSNGLDPEGIIEIRQLMKELASEKGVAIFISSHILGEISKVATRIGIIHHGALIRESEAADIQAGRKRSLIIKAGNPSGVSEVLSSKGYECIINKNASVSVTSIEAVNNPEMVNLLLSGKGYVPSMLVTEEEDLETYFLRVINNSISGK